MASKHLGKSSVPDEMASDQEILDFREAFFNYDSVYRCRAMERPALNLNYLLGRQWIELDTEILVDGARGYTFRDTPQPEGMNIPRPVTNYIAASVEVELSSLGKRQLVPRIYISSDDPRDQAAGKKAQEILEYRLSEIGWPAIREDVTFQTIATGTGIMKSYWDASHQETTMVASPDAMSCPCGVRLSSPFVSKASVVADEQSNIASMKPVPSDDPEMGEQFEAQGCPHCGQPMEPYEASEEEANGKDLYGRPMGVEVAKGNTAIEVVSVFDFFPENSGIDTTPENCKVWGQATVRSLDWVAERYPGECEDLMPEDPYQLMRYHPVLGEWGLIGRYDKALDAGIYDSHIRVYELCAEKSYRFPQGRYIVIAGDKVLENTKLYVTVDTKNGPISVPKVKYAAARWKQRHKEFWGQSLVDDIISPQNRLNGMDSQLTDTRELFQTPNIMTSEAMELSGPEWREEYGGGKIMRYSTDPLNPQATPTLFPSSMPNMSGVFQERQAIIQDIRELAGPQAIEVGEAPKNISTTSGLQLLNEKADSRRAPRERALIQMFQRIWEHQLKLLAAFRVEQDTYLVENENGDWEEEQFNRNALANIEKLVVEKQSYVDKGLYIKEAVREAQADGLYRLDSQLAIKKLLEHRGLPTDVNEDLNRQVELAQRQWTDFIDTGVIPVIDTTLDDFRIHFQTLGTLLLTDEGRKIEKNVSWYSTLKLIAGWEEELQRMEMQDQMAVAFYGGRPTGEQAAEMYAQAMMSYQQQMATFEQMNQAGAAAAQEMGGVASPMMPPPQEPPPPVFLPPAKEDRILVVWKGLIGKKSAELGMELPIDDNFLRFRAVVDAYKLLAEAKEMAAMMPMPAPGTPEGTPGMDGALPGMQSTMAPPGGGPAPSPTLPVPGPPTPNAAPNMGPK